MKILFSCEDFSEKSFASLINRARARPDSARPTSRQTPRQGAPKRSDGGVVLVLGSYQALPIQSLDGGHTAKRTAIHRTRRRQEGEDFGELSRTLRCSEPQW